MAFLSGEQKEPEVAAHILGRVGKQIIGGGWGGGGHYHFKDEIPTRMHLNCLLKSYKIIYACFNKVKL